MPSSVLRNIVPILPVRDIARAVAFYSKLGFTADLYKNPDEYAFIFRDGLEIQLRLANDLQEGRNPCGVYFRLAPGSAAALEAEFRVAGVPILSSLEPRDWKMNEFMVSDPDGNLLRFGEPLHAHEPPQARPDA